MPGLPLSEPDPDRPGEDRDGGDRPLRPGPPAPPLHDGLPAVERALAVFAHPDDIDFSCSGTIARLVDAGVTVTYLLATRGDQGGYDATVDRADVPVIREREQRAAAAEVGVDDVRFLDFRDGHVEADLSLREAISRVIRQVRPGLVFTHSPEWNWDAMPANHPDHMAVGEAAVRAVYPDARNAFAFPALLTAERLEPWTVRELWIAGHHQADTAVDITDVLDRKIAALQAHASQTADVDLRGLLTGWNGGVARAAGFGEGRFAENFRRVPIPL